MESLYVLVLFAACVVDTAPLSQNAWNKWHGSGSENGSSEVRIERSYPKPESSASAPPVRKSSVNPKVRDYI